MWIQAWRTGAHVFRPESATVVEAVRRLPGNFGRLPGIGPGGLLFLNLAQIYAMSFPSEIWAALEAERKMGEMLSQTERAKGAMGIGTSAVTSSDRTPPTLAELGLTKRESTEAQTSKTWAVSPALASPFTIHKAGKGIILARSGGRNLGHSTSTLF